MESANRFRNILKTFLVLVSAFGLFIVTGCGGGGSSSGAGGGSPAQYTGTYTGTGTATITGAGISISGVIETTIVIDTNGNVTIDPDEDPFTGTLNGNSFTASAPTSDFNEPGFTCTGSLIVSGTITGNTINGTYSSNDFSCNQVAFQVSGTFSATKISNASLLTNGSPGNSIVDTLREAIRSVK